MRTLKLAFPQVSDWELSRMVRLAQALPRPDERMVGAVFGLLEGLGEPLHSWAARVIAAFAANKGLSPGDRPLLQSFVGGFSDKLRNISTWLAANPEIDINQWEFGSAAKTAKAWFGGQKQEKKLSAIDPAIINAVRKFSTGDERADLFVAGMLQRAWTEQSSYDNRELSEGLRPLPATDFEEFLMVRNNDIVSIRDWIRYVKPSLNSIKSWAGLILSAKAWHEEIAKNNDGHPSFSSNGPGTPDPGESVEIDGKTMWVVEIPPDDFENEGSQMGHCVGTDPHYEEDARRGTLRAFSLRDEKNFPHVTWDITIGDVDTYRRDADIERYWNKRYDEEAEYQYEEARKEFIAENRKPMLDDVKSVIRTTLWRMGNPLGQEDFELGRGGPLGQLSPEQRSAVATAVRELLARPFIEDDELEDAADRHVEEEAEWIGESVNDSLSEEIKDDPTDADGNELFPEKNYVEDWDVEQIQGKEDEVPVAKYRPFLAKWFAEPEHRDWKVNSRDRLLITPIPVIYQQLIDGKLSWGVAEEYLDDEHRDSYLDEVLHRKVANPGITDAEMLIHCLKMMAKDKNGPDYGQLDLGVEDPVYAAFIKKNVYDAPPEDRAYLYKQLYDGGTLGERDDIDTLVTFPEGRKFLIDQIEREKDPIVADYLVRTISDYRKIPEFGNREWFGQYLGNLPQRFGPGEDSQSQQAAVQIAYSTMEALLFGGGAATDVAMAIDAFWKRAESFFQPTDGTIDRDSGFMKRVTSNFTRAYLLDAPRFYEIMKLVSPGTIHGLSESGILDLSHGWDLAARSNLEVPRDPQTTLEMPETPPRYLRRSDDKDFVYFPPPPTETRDFERSYEGRLDDLARPPLKRDDTQMKLLARTLAAGMLRVAMRCEAGTADRLERLAQQMVLPTMEEEEKLPFWHDVEQPPPGLKDRHKRGEPGPDDLFSEISNDWTGNDWHVALPKAWEKFHEYVYYTYEFENKRDRNGGWLNDQDQLRLLQVRQAMLGLGKHMAEFCHRVLQGWRDAHISGVHPMLSDEGEYDDYSQNEILDELKRMISGAAELARDYADATPKEIAEMLGVDWKPEWNGSTSRDAYEEIVDIATGNTEEGRQIDEDEEYDGTSEAIDHYENYGSQVREHPLFQRAREQQLREEHPSWGITGDLTDRLWKAQDVNDAVLPINLSKGVAHNTMSRNIFQDYGGVDPMVDYTPTFDAISDGTLEKEWERKLLSGDRLAAIRCQMLKLAANLEGVGMSEQADSLERAAR